MKILIVDDEEILRTGLSKMIERMELPAVVVGTANDGLQALSMIADHEPHVLLTDIRMPNMDGLELIERLAAKRQRIRSIILSGYDDFDYARKAMRSGCSDYLVKPPDYAELSDLLRSIYQELAQEREKFIEDHKKSELLNRNQLLLKTDFLRSLIAKKAAQPPSHERLDHAGRLGIPLRHESHAVAVLRIERRRETVLKYSTADWELFKYACLNIAGEVLGGAPCFYDEHEQLVILLPGCMSFDDCCEKLQEARRHLSHYLPMTFSAALSDVYPFHSIADAYEEANRLLSLRLLRDKSVLITCRDRVQHVNEDTAAHLEQLGELQRADSCTELPAQWNHWLESVKNAGYTPQALEKLKQELRAALFALLQKAADRQPGQASAVQRSEWLERLGHADSYADQLKLAQAWIEQMAERQKPRRHQNQAVEKAIAYIRQHYNQTINLVSISEHIHMNPAYFSVMFKRKTGVGVIEYLTQVRMDEAKKLLAETNLKTYQIAEAVGYHDPAYFTNIFKRLHGITPNEYRNKAAINVTRNP